MTEVAFIWILHGMLDILNKLNLYSLELQKRYGLLVIQVKTIQGMEGVMLLLATYIGPFSKSFLSEGKCWNGTVEPRMTGCLEQHLFDSDNITWQGVSLNQDSEFSNYMDLQGLLSERLLK